MLYDESIMTFSEAARTLPRIDGKRVHASTIWRWAQRGIRGIRLETRRVGGRFFTSREALERFTRALAELPPPGRQRAATMKDPKEARDRAIARAEARCKESGL